MICKLPSSSLRRDCIRGSIYEHPRDLGLYDWGALWHPLLIFPSPIIQLAPLRPTEVKGLAQSPTVGQKQSWDSNYSQHPSLRNEGSRENQGRKKDGIFQRPRTGLLSFAQASV